MPASAFSRVKLLAIVMLLVLLCGAGWLWHQVRLQQQLRFWIGQKLMLDIRHFCENTPVADKPCDQAVTKLPAQWQQQLRRLHIGGVVLFAVNLQNRTQIQALTTQLQQSRSDEFPMLIATDQEGGRVARLPEALLPAFSGAMALGATYTRHQTAFAEKQGAAQAAVMRQLGININFSPSLDVNSNPDNPVIGVRSFGDDPMQVAALGVAMARSLQQGGVAATLKHFPGHGDTATDSHTGLPIVNHVRAVAETIDVAPFQQAIEAGAARLVMTAHIQYPALDETQIQTAHGELIYPPATLSRPVLQGLLRQQLGFEGVVITDALNMQAIAAAFSPEQAVIRSFAAGADIALMPLEIKQAEDFAKLEQLIDAVVAAAMAGQLNIDELEASYQRVRDLKSWLALQPPEPAAVPEPTEQTADYAQQLRQLDLQIAQQSITLLAGDINKIRQAKQFQLMLPDADKCRRMTMALQQTFPDSSIDCTDLQAAAANTATVRIAASTKSDLAATKNATAKAGTVFIGAYIAPEQSAAEAGVLADVVRSPVSVSSQLAQLKLGLAQARQQGASTVLVALRSPYELVQFQGLADIRLATYAYPFSLQPDPEPGAVFIALAQILRGQIPPAGALPVRLAEDAAR